LKLKPLPFHLPPRPDEFAGLSAAEWCRDEQFVSLGAGLHQGFARVVCARFRQAQWREAATAAEAARCIVAGANAVP
jgi:hypothetical protein